MAFGAIEGMEPGTHFDDRRALYDSGVHRTLQAGIVGRAADGAESIVLSGGYVDDEDAGHIIFHTGDGGRDPQSGRQMADQEFLGKNQALVKNALQGLPVRVVRGAGHKSPFSPKSGYRYDGIYFVTRYWTELGEDGHRVCRYRLDSSEHLPLNVPKDQDRHQGEGAQARRIETTVQRIVRDTALGRQVKEIHDFTCQVCGTRLECEGGSYAEAAHIRPLGKPHNGPDELSNLLCLCPNHHVLLDYGGITVSDAMIVEPLNIPLRLKPKHEIHLDQLRYQRMLWSTG